MKVVTYIRWQGFDSELAYASTSELAVIGIIEHRAGGEGDKWFYDITYDDGRVVRVFNPIEVGLEEEKPT